LKKGGFKPEYAGKLNFYCNVVNDRLRHPNDQPTIGMILCQSRDPYVLTEQEMKEKKNLKIISEINKGIQNYSEKD
jgi:hypothetical protein